MGKKASANWRSTTCAKAAYAATTLAQNQGTTQMFSGAPRFHEFVLNTVEAPSHWNQRLMDEKIVGGIDLSRWYPELGNATLWCATEMITREQIDTAAKVLAAGLVEA